MSTASAPINSGISEYGTGTSEEEKVMADSYRFLGDALRRKNKKKAACKAYRGYLELARPGDPARGDAERFLYQCP